MYGLPFTMWEMDEMLKPPYSPPTPKKGKSGVAKAKREKVKRKNKRGK